MFSFYKENRDYVNKILYTMLFFAAVYIVIKFLLPFIAPFVFGYLFSLLLSPFVNFLEKKFKAGRGLATAFVMIVFILIVGFIINLIAVNVSRQAQAFAEALPEYARQTNEAVLNFETRFNRFFELMPQNLRSFFNTAMENFEEGATNFMSSALQMGGGGLIRTIPAALIGTLIWLVSSFFFTKDRYVIKNFMQKKTPDSVADGFEVSKEKMGEALKGYVKAQLTIMSIIAVIATAGLFAMRYPYALLVGIIIAFVDALPLFGSGLIIIPWAIISAISGDMTRMVSLLALYLAIILARQLLEPKILGNRLGVHPILMLLSIYVGLRLFGVLGIIAGPISVVMAVGMFSDE